MCVQLHTYGITMHLSMCPAVPSVLYIYRTPWYLTNKEHNFFHTQYICSSGVFEKYNAMLHFVFIVLCTWAFVG